MFNQYGFDRDGFARNGFNRAGFDRAGYPAPWRNGPYCYDRDGHYIG